MKLAYDLHIHSVLSPCADRLMTPHNIFNMAMLKELDMIAITDHNALFQAPIYHEIQESYDFLFLYGAEITVSEGFHVLVYFEKVKEALLLQEVIHSYLVDYPAKFPENQTICNVLDDEIASYPYDLYHVLKLSFHELSKKVHALGGLVILAHVDRNHFGIIHKNVSLLKEDIDAIEVKDLANLPIVLEEYPILQDFKILHNSDAHTLENMHEADYTIECDDKTFASFKKALS
ncbi:MAG: PHP domain-containing protein [Bacilli bacterium]|nr:PHP domain-containing protein [Bacilli bacterium]